MNYDFFTTEDMEAFRVLSSFLVIPALPVIQRSIATKDLSASTNSPLERGRGVLECIELCILRFAHDTPPAPSLEGSSLAYCHYSGKPSSTRQSVAKNLTSC